MNYPAASHSGIDSFIARWTSREGGAERANYALFLTELCDLIGVERPMPSGAEAEKNDYVFERSVRFSHDDGSGSTGRIDLYKRGCFVLEAKQSRIRGAAKEIAGQNDLFAVEVADEIRGRRGADRAWDVLMLNAKRQAEEYARALPVAHGWPPFVLVCDVGHCIEVYADFSGQGKNYTQFPDRQGFRVFLEDLRSPEIRDRLVRIWREPQSLDPSRIAAKATREIAERLAAVSKALESKKYDPEEVAHFLMRCLFTMFAEDMRLLPENAFRELLAECRTHPDKFVPLLGDLWRAMNDGEFAASIRTKVLKFNGNLFRSAKVLPLGREEIGELAAAADKSWKDVEPAIFGTLLEQALDPAERRRLGAHYTPRAYVERLVVATIIEPLREDWRNVQATAETLRAADDHAGAAAAVKTFHDTLCATRVLDPACGTGNFLYVAMELMKKLEGEVLEALLDLGGQEALTGLGGHTVDPHQFLGLELNPRAAAIAELVLWIGYLQAHFRTKGGTPEPPILKAFKNIEVKNAVLCWDGYPSPQIVDGQETYPNPRRQVWPAAEFIVGNPPFIGARRIRKLLGSHQVEALRSAHDELPRTIDYVMYWWDHAAKLLSNEKIRRFGLITTNSIVQDYSRPVLENYISGETPICKLVYAITNHPWVDTQDGAAVRIAMTVVAPATESQKARIGIVRQADGCESVVDVEVEIINSSLRPIPNVLACGALKSNLYMCLQGVVPAGEGFKIEPARVNYFSGEVVLRPYIIGNDLTERWDGKYIIDAWGLEEEDLRRSCPRSYQQLLSSVRAERSLNRRKVYRDNWWIFAEPRPRLRDALSGLERYIGTPYTAVHRVFTFIESEYIPDAMVYTIPTDDAFILGALSSRVHYIWCRYASGTLEDRPRYNSRRTFYPFPFPLANGSLIADIRALAAELDAFRKERQREHPRLTLTQMYNVLERLKAIEAGQDVPLLSPDEERIKDDGLILILKELHKRLDAMVFRAYGWPDNLSDEEIVARLVALNHERAAEEKRGVVRWLRPDYQIPRFGKPIDRQAAEEEGAQIGADLDLAEKEQKPAFPAGAVEQTAAVFAALARASGPLDAAAIASTFRQGKRVEKKIAAVLMSVARLGHVASTDGGRSFSVRRAS